MGGFLTILCAGFLVYAFLNISRDCFYKTNPTVRDNSYYDDYTVVNGNKFFFGIYFTDEKYNLIQNPERYLIFHGLVSNYTENLVVTTIPFSKCSFERHFNKTGVPLQRISEKIKDFEESYCLDIDDNFNLINSGTEIPRLSLSINVIECMNRTIENINCKNYFILII